MVGTPTTVSAANACDSLPAMNISAPLVSVAVRSAADPYVAAGTITRCTFDFGETAAQYKSTGIGLTVAGFILLCFCCGGGMYMSKRAASAKMLTPMGVEMMQQPVSMYGQRAPMGYGGGGGYMAPMAVQPAYAVSQPAFAGGKPAYAQSAFAGGKPAYAAVPGQQWQQPQQQQPQQQWQQPAYGAPQAAYGQQGQQYAGAPAGGGWGRT